MSDASSVHLLVRQVTSADRDALATLVFEQEGGAYEEHLKGAEKELTSERADNLVMVAEAEGRLVGFGRARRFEHPAETASTRARELVSARLIVASAEGYTF